MKRTRPTTSWHSDIAASLRAPKILVVDDERLVRRLTCRWLAEDGYACRTAGSGAAALEALEGEHSDLMVTDMLMPGMSGIELLRTARTSNPDLAVIMVTGVDDPEIANQCLKLGAYGYVVKPLERNEILINVANALERRRLTIESATFQHRLEEQVRERTADIRRREEELCERLVGATEYRDETTGAHVRRIGLYAETLAEALGWNLAGMADIRLAAPMHDVGKIAIPDEVLLKQGPLTSAEFDIVKRHTTIGAQMLSGSSVSAIQMAESIALSHHERWDGGGYPRGLRGSAIPEAARVVAVLDVYDALIHDRIYRPALPETEALAMLQAERGRHFDSRIFDAFLAILSDLRDIARG